MSLFIILLVLLGIGVEALGDHLLDILLCALIISLQTLYILLGDIGISHAVVAVS